jgi:hypothetical protein
VNLKTLQSTLALALSLHLGLLSAAAPAIGTILTKGAFRVDNASVIGNATLFEGSVLETALAPSSVQLNTGARVSLAADSRGRLFGDRLVLEKGATDLENSTGFHLVALGLTIRPDRSASTGSVVLESPHRVRVSAMSGSFRVLNANGQVVANLAAGSALAFEPQTGPSTALRVTGQVRVVSGHYLLTDEVANITVEIVGVTLDKEVGNRVEITGSTDPSATPMSPATQLVRVREVRRVGAATGSVAAAAGKGGAIAGAAAGHGMLIGTIAIIGGVATAATVGGLAARSSSQSSTATSASRN